MHSRTALLRLWFALTALAGLASSAWLASIPADPKNAVLLGFSASRLALLAILLSVSAVALLLTCAPAERLQRLQARLARPALIVPAWLVGITAASLAGHSWTETLQLTARLLPAVVFLAAAGFLAAGFLFVLAGRAVKSGGGPDSRFIFILIFTVAWLPRSLSLGHFVTVDEPTWLERSGAFFLALHDGDFAGTFQAEHPGVTLMWAQTLAYRWRLGDGAVLADPDLTPHRLQEHLIRQGSSELELLAVGRALMALLSAGSIALATVCAARFLQPAAAVAGGLLLALDPFHIAHTRLLMMDGHLASLFCLSVLAYLAWCSSGRRSDLLLSGLAAGLAWLTKTPGLFLVPVVGALGIIHYFAVCSDSLRRRMLVLIASSLAWAGAGLLVFFLLFPAMWAAPAATISQMLSRTLDYAAEGHLGSVFFAGRIYPDGRIPGLGFPLASILWRSTPLVLVGLAAAAWAGFQKKPPFSGLAQLALAAVIFTALQSVGEKKFDRYFLAAFPLLDFIAGAGLVAVLAWLKKRSLALARAGGAAAAIAALLPALTTHPYYLSYYNPLLGGPARAPETMMIGWGEGLDEAGRYLNALPNPESLQVIAWYNRGSFSYFFKGDSQHLPTNQQPRPERIAEILEMDYVVIYIHQWQRNMPANLLSILADLEPVHVIVIDGIEYVRIYKMD